MHTYNLLEKLEEIFSIIFFIDKKRFCFAVGDVSDKGVPAAFFMAMTMTLLKKQCNVTT